MGENAAATLRQHDMVKITDQAEALFKQKRWFKTKTNDRVASRLEVAFKKLWWCVGGRVELRQFRPVLFSPCVTSTRVNFKFDPLHHICVFKSTVHFMSFNICIYETDLYLKVITER